MANSPSENAPEPVDWSSQVAYLRELANIAKEEKLSELEIESDGVRLTLKGQSEPTFVAGEFPVATPAPLPASAPAAPAAGRPGSGRGSSAADEGTTAIVSPMVGVFFRAPSPADPNFVEIGDRVERGQTIGLVEAMKVFNEITAETAGVVVEIRASNGDLVETGQALVTLKKA